MTVTIEVITENDIRQFARGELKGSERDRIGDFIDRDDEANAVYQRALGKHDDALGPSRSAIKRSLSARQAQMDGTARRIALAAAVILGTAITLASIIKLGVLA